MQHLWQKRGKKKYHFLFEDFFFSGTALNYLMSSIEKTTFHEFDWSCSQFRIDTFAQVICIIHVGIRQNYFNNHSHFPSSRLMLGKYISFLYGIYIRRRKFIVSFVTNIVVMKNIVISKTMTNRTGTANWRKTEVNARSEVI